MNSRPQNILLAFIALVLAIPAAAGDTCSTCSKTPAKADASPEKHPLKGVVRRVNLEKSQATVKHEEIPGFMAAMTMVFKVTPEDAARLKEGQQIEGMLSRADGNWVLTDIRIIAETK